VTASPPAGFNPATMGCYEGDSDSGIDGGPLPPLFWRNQCVGYSFQPSVSSKVTLAQATSVAAQAFGAWSSAACATGTPSIFAVQLPTVDCNTVPSQAHNNVIIFRDDSWPYDDAANSIGYTTLTVQLSDGEILGADIEINSATYDIIADGGAVPAGGGAYDLGSILTHEAGHFLGLAHSADPTAVMYAFYHPGSTTLTPDDVSGICSIYTPEGPHSSTYGPIASTSCDPTPPLGFLTECGSLDAGFTVDSVGSGAGPNAFDPGASGDTCTYPSCGVSAAPGGLGARLAALGVAALAAGVGLARRRARRGRGAVIVGIMIATLGASALHARDARAAVSAAALFEQLVGEAGAAAVVSPVEARSVWEGGRIATYTRVRVDRLIAGELGGDAEETVWIRTRGGAVGDIGQIVEGDAKFAEGRPSLVFLRPHVDPATGAPTGTFVVVERAQGQFPVVTADRKSVLGLGSDLGALVEPPAAQVARAAQRLPAGVSPRFARDVLAGRTVDDAAREIARAWARMH